MWLFAGIVKAAYFFVVTNACYWIQVLLLQDIFLLYFKNVSIIQGAMIEMHISFICFYSYCNFTYLKQIHKPRHNRYMLLQVSMSIS